MHIIAVFVQNVEDLHDHFLLQLLQLRQQVGVFCEECFGLFVVGLLVKLLLEDLRVLRDLKLSLEILLKQLQQVEGVARKVFRHVALVVQSLQKSVRNLLVIVRAFFSGLELVAGRAESLVRH